MTDIVNDLRTALAERQKVMKGGGELYRRAADEIERLRDVNDQTTAALEAAERRAEAWKRLCGSTETATTEVIEERDQLAAAVESAVATGDQAWGTGNFDWYDLRDILATPATAPADALREHDAAIIEELADEIRHKQHAESIRQMLREKARQRREERP